MVVIDLANELERLSSSSDIDGQNSTMSNFIKRDLSFCGSNLNQFMTVVVFRHWLTLMVFATFAMVQVFFANKS